MSKISKIKVNGELYSISDLATQDALNSEAERAYAAEESIKKDFEGILAKVDDSFNRLNTLTQNSGEGSIQEQINESIENKQDKLISGNNIKTINGLSLMGSGNIDLETLSGSSSADIAPNTSTLRVESTENNTTLLGNTIGGDDIVINFPAATTETAGVMSSEDKVALDTATSRALRALFIAAGAEYNDTSNDITKTAPWGETVTHKAGHYYLNGLGDITEEEMMDIYIYTMDKYSSTNLTNFCRKQTTTDKLVRTNLRNKNFYTGENNDVSLLCSGMNNNIIEVFCVNHTNITNNSNIGYLIENATSCKAVIGIIEIKLKNSYSLKNTPKLEYIKIKSLKDNINIGESPLISLDSVLYMIQNASPTSAITITLHPNAYTRLAEDADIVAALEAQPLITLVSA